MSQSQVNDVNANQNMEDEVEIDLIELLYFYRSKLLFIILSFIVGVLVSGVITYCFITPKYKATSKLYMVSASTDSIVNLADLNLGTSLSEDYAELIQTRPVIESVIKELNLSYTYEELLGMLSVGTVSKTRILTITTTSTIPEEARDISNALVSKAITYLPSVMETAEPNIAEQAIVPTMKSSPSYAKNMALGSIGCIVLCLGILTVIFIKDDTMKTAEDIEKIFGVMPLTVIPEGNLGQDKERKQRDKANKRRKKTKSREGGRSNE